MQLTTFDWFIVLALTTLSFVPALVLARRAGSSTAEFFTSGRSAPWWLVGVSMVATTFSTDTPNLVTNLVREHGVANNWVWWAFLLTGMMTVFFYARLWRRSGVLTDLEFYEIRYSGKAASLVRGFRAVYLGLVFNCFIMATVNLAAVKIATVVLGWPDRSNPRIRMRTSATPSKSRSAAIEESADVSRVRVSRVIAMLRRTSPARKGRTLFAMNPIAIACQSDPLGSGEPSSARRRMRQRKMRTTKVLVAITTQAMSGTTFTLRSSAITSLK